jgi:hypothetical protein
MPIKSIPLEGKLDKWVLKLKSLDGLQAGWDGYDAPPPGEKALENASAFLVALNLTDDLEPALLSASTVGGVGITFAASGREAYVEFYSDSRVFAILSNGHDEPHIVESGREMFSKTLESIRDYLHG